MLVKKKRSNIYKKLNIALKLVFDLPKLKLVNSSITKERGFKIIKIMENFNLRARNAYHLLIIQENKIDYFLTFDKDFENVFKMRIVKKFGI